MKYFVPFFILWCSVQIAMALPPATQIILKDNLDQPVATVNMHFLKYLRKLCPTLIHRPIEEIEQRLVMMTGLSKDEILFLLKQLNNPAPKITPPKMQPERYVPKNVEYID